MRDMIRRTFLATLTGLPLIGKLFAGAETDSGGAVEKIWRLKLREMDQLLLRQRDYPLYFLPVEIEMFSRDARPNEGVFDHWGLKTDRAEWSDATRSVARDMFKLSVRYPMYTRWLRLKIGEPCEGEPGVWRIRHIDPWTGKEEVKTRWSRNEK